MSYFNGARLRELRKAKRMSMFYVQQRTGISKAQISLIENGKVDPRMSTVVRILSCLDAGLADLEPSSPEVITVDKVVERARIGARTLESVGLGPSDPGERLDRRAGDPVAALERAALTTRR
jgi:transcriptional regulator with XRE-family HTH domain